MPNNPYEAPRTDVLKHGGEKQIELLNEPRKTSIGHGWKWIKEGFSLFKKEPALWIGIFLIYFGISMLMSMIPLVSLLSTIINPVFMGGLMYGAYQLDQGKPLEVGHLFAGFQQRAGALFAVGALYLLGIVVIMILAGILIYATGGVDTLESLSKTSESPTLPQATQSLAPILIPALIAMGLIIPLAMMVWFAPALIMINNMGAIEAMKHSLKGCVRNMLPYLWYAIIATFLVILGIIPLMLGLLVVMPLLTIAMYTSYKDIFLK